MDLFRKLNDIEDGIRRGNTFKANTEKMGEPVIMGEEATDTEDSEKCASLMGKLDLYGKAVKGGVRKCNTCGCNKEVQADLEIKAEPESVEPASQDLVPNRGESSAPAPDHPMADDEDKLEDCVTCKDVFGADFDEQGYAKRLDEIYEKAMENLDADDFVDDVEGEAEVVGEDNNEQLQDTEQPDKAQEEGDNYAAKSIFGSMFEKAKSKGKSRRDLRGEEEMGEAKAEASELGSKGKKADKPKTSTKSPEKKMRKKDMPEEQRLAEGRDKRGKKRGEGIKSNVTAADIFGSGVDMKSVGGGSAGKGRSHRQRREPGEIWMGRYGVGKHPETMVAWTKWEDNSIVRVKKYGKDGKETPEFKKLKEAAAGGWRGEEGLGGKKDKEGKTVTRWVKIVPKWAEQSGISEGAWKRFTEYCKEQGYEPTKNFAHAILGFKTTLGARGWGRSQAQLKQDFIDGIDKTQFKNQNEFNAVRDRINKMTPEQFEVMLHSINSEEEDDERSLVKYNNARAEAGMGPHPTMAKSFEDQVDAIIKSMNI